MALKSLFSFEKETPLFEVIVVNNDPSESAALQALRPAFPFLLIESGQNSGFGRGNNLGARQAQGKILGFINPDTVWLGAHLRDIADVFDAHPKVGVVGMTLLDEHKRPERWSAGEEPSLKTLLCNNLFPSRYAVWRGESRDGLSFPDWVSGGGLFIRTALFSDIGGFDERFFLYFEDIDVCTEARKRHFSVARLASATLTHVGGGSFHSRRLQKTNFYASQMRYFGKHRPVWEWQLLRCLHFFRQGI